MDQVTVYDTTLRDGMQGEGVSFSLQDKLDIARRLDDLGVHYIEAGYPVSNPKEESVFRELKRKPPARSVVVAFGMTRRVGVRAEEDAGLGALLAAETPAVTIVGKAWGFHVAKVLRASPEENRAMIADSVRLAKAAGREVFFDAEHYFDGYRENREDALKVLRSRRRERTG